MSSNPKVFSDGNLIAVDFHREISPAGLDLSDEAPASVILLPLATPVRHEGFLEAANTSSYARARMEALLGESLREVQTRLYWSFSLASQGSWEAYEAFMELKSRFSSAASGRPKIQAALAGLEERLLQKVQSGDIQCGAY